VFFQHLCIYHSIQKITQQHRPVLLDLLSQVVDVAAAESTPEIARKLEDLVKARRELHICDSGGCLDFNVVSRRCTSSGS
jgi:hypothetical protein